MADQAPPKITPLNDLQKLVSLSKRRGFVFQSSEIYGGINACWDYGPLGAELKLNVKRNWWNAMTRRPDIEGLDAAILMHPLVWKASGHVDGFTDPLVDCKKCKSRFRADQLAEVNAAHQGHVDIDEQEVYSSFFYKVQALHGIVEAGGYFQETMPRNIFFQQHSFQSIVIDDNTIQIFHAWNKVGGNKDSVTLGNGQHFVLYLRSQEREERP